jgi:uncharacterized OB-fold protein
MKATHKCERCGTEYFTKQECDWCPGEEVQPIREAENVEQEREAA